MQVDGSAPGACTPAVAPAHPAHRRNRLQMATSRSNIRPALKFCGAADDICVARVGRSGVQPTCTAGPGWRGSSHSATSVRLIPRHHRTQSGMGLGLSRNLRTHPRREEPADRAVAVPLRARRTGVSRQGRRTPACRSTRRTRTRRWRTPRWRAATPMTPQDRELSRYFFANAQELELDSAGRVMLPGDLHGAGRDRRARADRGWHGRVPGDLGPHHLAHLRRDADAARA